MGGLWHYLLTTNNFMPPATQCLFLYRTFNDQCEQLFRANLKNGQGRKTAYAKRQAIVE